MASINREERRRFFGKGRQSFSPEQVEVAKLLFLRNLCKGRFQEGDKVKLNKELMTEASDWERKTAEYRNWCEAHFERELTVEYDDKTEVAPEMVCIAEDETKPKWLFSVIDLEPVSGDDGFLDMVSWAANSYKK